MENRNDEVEINLKSLFMAVVYQWKKVLIYGVVFAVLLGSAKAFLTAYSIGHKDADGLASGYERQLAAYEQEKANLTTTAKDLDVLIDEKEKYIEKSTIMNCNPNALYGVKVMAYITTDYQLHSDSTVQNENKTSSVVSSYNALLGSSAVRAELGASIGKELEYFNETYTVSYDSSVLYVTFWSGSETEVETVRKEVVKKLNDFIPLVTESVTEHRVEILDDSTYSYTDSSLFTYQSDIKKELTDLQQEYYDTLEDLEELEKDTVLDKPDTVKSGIKYGIVGFIVGAFLVCAWYAAKYIFSPKVYSHSEFEDRTGVRVLTVMENAPSKGFDARLRRIENKPVGFDDADAIAVLAENIRNYTDESVKKVLLAGMSDTKKISSVCEMLKAKLTEFEVIGGANLLSDAATLNTLGNIDAVVFVETAGVSTYEGVCRQATKVTDIGKKLVGAVLVE